MVALYHFPQFLKGRKHIWKKEDMALAGGNHLTVAYSCHHCPASLVIGRLICTRSTSWICVLKCTTITIPNYISIFVVCQQ